ncbi:MAG: hypothetical protein WC979_04760 [Candidatus Pacearchaeota archaeon]|jgi:hypothetical protein
MICPVCKEEVWVLNLCAPKEKVFNEPTEACYDCRQSYNLQILEYPIEDSKDKEFKAKEPNFYAHSKKISRKKLIKLNHKKTQESKIINEKDTNLNKFG